MCSPIERINQFRRKDTKINAHLQISPKKNCTKVHFCAGVPASARIRAGATAQKVIAQRYFLRGETLPKCPALPCSTFGGWRSQLTFGFERKWQRGASPRRRYRGVPKYKKMHTKKAAGSHDSTAFAQIFAMNYFQIMRYLRYRRMSSRVIFFWVNNFCFLRSTIIDNYQQFFSLL